MKFWVVLGLLVFGMAYGTLPQLDEEVLVLVEEVLALVKEQSPENWKQEVETIDQAVIKLTDLRNKELSNAAWAQNQGDRLQFQSHNLLDARRYWNEADTSREIAARYQEEIDKLEVRKKEILDQQGIQYQSSESNT
ncbi:hypothetical protein [Candidatus Neptunichlamydia sp. REUL1]|uniref:hypothetical protein n=1 Tax=Candidatus Neptunichlamydia sp. REUL1 TaxID=3064277 RepID=UPI00292DA332|nr:hypothetical protein [Candidatus Neptunochlamydia sp. REUL1]